MGEPPMEIVMSISRFVTFAAVLVAVGLPVTLLDAAQHGDRNRGGGGAAAERAAPRAAPAPRVTEAPRIMAAPPARAEQHNQQDRGRQTERRQAPVMVVPRASEAPRAAVAPNARMEQRDHQNRVRAPGRSVAPGVAAPRAGGAPNVVTAQPYRSLQGERDGSGRSADRHNGNITISPRITTIASRWRAFSRPYYAFRPRLSIGLGFYVGYPVSFPSFHDYPYPYGDYEYYGPPYGTAGNTYGGVMFVITPDDASVYVDDIYAGPVENFSPTSPPLALTAGLHHITIAKTGYQAMAFDVNIVPGEVIPYQAALQHF
jgi:hypothetical protein